MRKTYLAVKKYIKTHPKTDIWVLVIGLAIFAAIALANATRASIWFDEAFSAYIAQFSYWDILRYTANDVHPPVYYWALKTWSYLFGTTDLALRSLSIFFGAGVITAMFFLTRKLFGRAIAWTSLLFLILSPMLIRYSDEARMYTLAALIVVAATYVMLRAIETKSRKRWVGYGLLVALGMWTHYFTAFVWLAHWAWRATQTWRKGDGFKLWWRRFFTKDWVVAHVVAVATFFPWLVVMTLQLGGVQATGFWIGPVSIDTPANYLGNYFYYLEHYEVQGWLAFGMIALLGLVVILLPKVYKRLNSKEKRSFLLIASLSWVPPILLFLTSLPPLRPSFVERYLLPAIVFLSVFLAIVLIVGTRRWKALFRAIPIVIVVVMMIFGITKVFYYGNFNKNTMYHIFTKQVVEGIQSKAKPGEPIIAQTPWVFYEAIPYTTFENPIYYLEESLDGEYGSLTMLADQDRHKIKDLAAFEKEHPVIWYLGQNSEGDMNPPRAHWQKGQTVQITDEITGKTIFRAAEFRVN